MGLATDAVEAQQSRCRRASRTAFTTLAAGGFLKYAGAPIASVPVLVVAGALASLGGLSFPGLVVAAALGPFVLLDGLALLIWSGFYGGVGWLFSTEVEQVLEWAGGFKLLTVAVASALIVAAGIRRFAKVRTHRVHHQAMKALPARSPTEPGAEAAGRVA